MSFRRMLARLNERLGFTPTESRVVLFLLLSLAAGLGIKAYRAAAVSPKIFDYTASDSEFAARSSVPIPADSADDFPDRSVPKIKEESIASPVNINNARKDDLVRLPGIGEAMAERIIMYREENGPFTSVDELRRVRGIGKKKLAKIAPYCTLGK